MQMEMVSFYSVKIKVMKAIIENGNTYKVTGERGAFTITEDVKGKIKMFQTSTIEIVEIDEMPKAKIYKQQKSSKEAIERNHKQYLAKQREADFQDKYLECQRSTKF